MMSNQMKHKKRREKSTTQNKFGKKDGHIRPGLQVDFCGQDRH